MPDVARTLPRDIRRTMRHYARNAERQKTVGRICEGKKRYETEARAIRGALSYSRHNGGGVRTYYCPICHGWHLTTHSKSGKSLKNEFAKAMDERSTDDSLER